LFENCSQRDTAFISFPTCWHGFPLLTQEYHNCVPQAIAGTYWVHFKMGPPLERRNPHSGAFYRATSSTARNPLGLRITTPWYAFRSKRCSSPLTRYAASQRRMISAGAPWEDRGALMMTLVSKTTIIEGFSFQPARMPSPGPPGVRPPQAQGRLALVAREAGRRTFLAGASRSRRREPEPGRGRSAVPIDDVASIFSKCRGNPLRLPCRAGARPCPYPE